MNSHKTTIIVLLALLVCSSFTIGYLIDKNFYIKVVNNNPVTTEITLGDVVNTTSSTTAKEIDYPNTSPAKYEVKKGDTLDTIAKLFAISKETIIKANNLKTENISAGDVLLIPFGSTR